ncbi:patatin-like phospholipase family protein [Roseomonas sp. E05]|uniref:patatin-like phospholipase family protein n=1 Tax=Roseomonas sp. E05 TaxID=3046310 RepID=UPI0024B953AB|nr:patatin-like phospholipase family protein [Roseomonas sp. E05]MDJ0389082.1 patatin-like phospholipase family protein [Roseomonas sp. E05]
MTVSTEEARGRRCALALSGGIALGTFEAGAYAALHEAGLVPGWIAGTSIGAINAALILGNPPERRVERLRQFWSAAEVEPMPLTTFWLGSPLPGPWRQVESLLSALQTHLLGCPSLFRPRLGLPGTGAADVAALYDLAPLRAQLTALVDFGRLNSGEARLSIAATDILSGERITFDTARGDRIGPDHLLASSALLPLFPPVEVEGRLLGDGGLTGNLPIDLILDGAGDGPLLCFAIELFARHGPRPQGLSAGAARALDIVFGSQSRHLLEARRREHDLRRALVKLADRLPAELREDPALAPLLAKEPPSAATILCLSYRAGRDEAGADKVFDFSRTTLAQRWEAGAAAMRAALALQASLPPAAGLDVHEIPCRAGPGPAEG